MIRQPRRGGWSWTLCSSSLSVLRKLVEAGLRQGTAPSEIEAKIETVFAEGGENLTPADRDVIRQHVGEGGTPKPL